MASSGRRAWRETGVKMSGENKMKGSMAYQWQRKQPGENWRCAIVRIAHFRALRCASGIALLTLAARAAAKIEWREK